jgi:uncharacterized protein (TIGR02246 family)
MNVSKMIRTALVLALASVSLVATAQENVKSLAKEWTIAYNSHNRAKLGALYAPDAQLMMHGRPTIKGRQAIEEFWAADFKEKNPLTSLIITNFVQGIDMILVHGNYQVIDRDDGTQLGFGRFAHIWLRDASGKWLLDRDLWNQPYEEPARQQ